jgi:hypothetical protein
MSGDDPGTPDPINTRPGHPAWPLSCPDLGRTGATAVTSDQTGEAIDPTSVLLTERQLSERWQINPGALANQRAAKRSGVPFVKIGAMIRYRLSDVLAYEQTVSR